MMLEESYVPSSWVAGSKPREAGFDLCFCNSVNTSGYVRNLMHTISQWINQMAEEKLGSLIILHLYFNLISSFFPPSSLLSFSLLVTYGLFSHHLLPSLFFSPPLSSSPPLLLSLLSLLSPPLLFSPLLLHLLSSRNSLPDVCIM